MVLVVRMMVSLRISGETWREQTRFRLVIDVELVMVFEVIVEFYFWRFIV